MHDSGYCWRPEWTYPGESLWSLMNKFMLLNQLGPTDLRAVFYRDAADRRPFPSSLKKILTNEIFGYVSTDRLIEVLGLSPEQIRLSTVNAFGFARCYMYGLRYCPSCLRAGYHSAFHQLEIFQHCPIHGDALGNGPLKCGHSPGGDLISVRKGRPYACCKCGQPYYDSFDGCGESLAKPLRRFTNEFLQLAEFSRGCFEKDVRASQFQWPSPERYLFHYLVGTKYQRDNTNELRRTIRRWAYVTGSSPEWIENACPGIPPQSDCHTLTLSRGISGARSLGGKGHGNSDYSFRAEYKSVRRRFRRVLLRERAQKARLCELEREILPRFLDKREGARRVETSDNTDHLFASAYFLFCLRHDHLLKHEKNLGEAVRNADAQDCELLHFVDHSHVTSTAKIQAIKRIFVEECVSTMVECLIRLLAQRKHGQFVYDLCYRGHRYDPHWLIDARCPDVVKMVVWPKKPQLSEVIEFIRKRGY